MITRRLISKAIKKQQNKGKPALGEVMVILDMLIFRSQLPIFQLGKADAGHHRL